MQVFLDTGDVQEVTRNIEIESSKTDISFQSKTSEFPTQSLLEINFKDGGSEEFLNGQVEEIKFISEDMGGMYFILTVEEGNQLENNEIEYSENSENDDSAQSEETKGDDEPSSKWNWSSWSSWFSSFFN